MRKRKKNVPLVLVEWEDSVQPVPSWRYAEDVGKPTPVLCHSVGWLIADTAKAKALAPNVAGISGTAAPQVSGVITIPARAVRRQRKLKAPW